MLFSFSRMPYPNSHVLLSNLPPLSAGASSCFFFFLLFFPPRVAEEILEFARDALGTRILHWRDQWQCVQPQAKKLLMTDIISDMPPHTHTHTHTHTYINMIKKGYTYKWSMDLIDKISFNKITHVVFYFDRENVYMY